MMIENQEVKQRIYDLLREKKIAFEVHEHEAVDTVEEIDALKLPHGQHIVKNLFLRDDKGKAHFLAVLPKDKKANLDFLREQLKCRKLSFASEERLNRYLCLKKGSVTPFGVINDTEKAVKVVVDRSLIGSLVGVHPNDNRATVFLKFDDLIRVIKDNGNEIYFVEFD